MFRPRVQTVVAMIFGLAASIPVQCQIVDQWFVREIYSNADGSVQFVKIEIGFGLDPQNGLVGRTLVASNGSVERSFTFTRFIDCPLCTDGDVSSFIVRLVCTGSVGPSLTAVIVMFTWPVAMRLPSCTANVNESDPL